jgi:hypothetical protein
MTLYAIFKLFQVCICDCQDNRNIFYHILAFHAHDWSLLKLPSPKLFKHDRFIEWDEMLSVF